jgi:hypothetical protein
MVQSTRRKGSLDKKPHLAIDKERYKIIARYFEDEGKKEVYCYKGITSPSKSGRLLLVEEVPVVEDDGAPDVAGDAVALGREQRADEAGARDTAAGVGGEGRGSGQACDHVM